MGKKKTETIQIYIRHR